MPRQPLSPKLHKGPWSRGIAVGERRPEHLALIGRCLALWPDVEVFMSLLMSLLLGPANDASVAVYLSLRNARARLDALRAAASIAMTDRELALFNAVLLVYSKAELERNALAHGCFGVHENIEDGIIWVPTQDEAHWLILQWRKEETGTYLGDEHAQFAARMFVYTKKDLQQIYQQIHDTWSVLFELVGYLRRPHQPSVARTQQDIYQDLANVPAVKQALAEIAVRKKPA